LKIVLPVAGRGTRFEPMTNCMPKCLVHVRQKPLALWALECLDWRPADVVLVANERERSQLDTAFDSIFGRACVRVWTPDTAGAPHTVMKAMEFIDSAEELLIITPDLLWAADLDALRNSDADAGLVCSTKPQTEPVELQRRYSYCALDAEDRVHKVVEKPHDPSDMPFANVGVYWWRHGSDFVRLARAYLHNAGGVNGERYIAPIYNLAIAGGMVVRTVEATDYYNLGSAERCAAFEGWGTC